MTQLQALEILKTGANVFLTGEPGAGKTYTLNNYLDYLKARKVDVAITASTGIAATHIGGMTIHSWSGIGIKQFLTSYDIDRIASNEYVCKRINRAKVLVIDEVSMLSGTTLSNIDLICRECKRSSAPFGGLQVILVGDFFQLPPVEKNSAPQNPDTQFFEQKKERFAYESNAWKTLSPVVCYLSEQHRQEDANFLEILSAIRRNEVDEMHFERIQERMIKPENDTSATKLFSHNANVDELNHAELEKLDSKSKLYEMTSDGNDHLVATLKKGCLSPEMLQLKKEASVMFTKNNPQEGFVNGTLGIVEDFTSSGAPIVKIKNGKKIVVEPMEWTVVENNKVKARITQLPLRLAWAMTVHKSQGMSLDSAVMDLSQVFEFGQGYVALSRVRSLAGLYILGINNQAFQVHPQILEEDRTFREKSTQAGDAFAELPPEELKTMHKNFITASGGKWVEEKKAKKGKTEKNKDEGEVKEKGAYLKKLREKYPNAYTGWNDEDEEKLKELFKEGKSIKELVEIFGRQTGGIRSRLVKLGLIEE